MCGPSPGLRLLATSTPCWKAWKEASGTSRTDVVVVAGSWSHKRLRRSDLLVRCWCFCHSVLIPGKTTKRRTPSPGRSAAVHSPLNLLSSKEGSLQVDRRRACDLWSRVGKTGPRLLKLYEVTEGRVWGDFHFRNSVENKTLSFLA
jgi:hypothetical protein